MKSTGKVKIGKLFHQKSNKKKKTAGDSDNQREITVKKKKPKAKKNLNLFTKIAIIVFAAFVIISVYNMQTQVDSLKEQKAELEEQIAAYRNQIDELQADVDTPFDKNYIVKVAREKLGFFMAGEIVFYNDIAN